MNTYTYACYLVDNQGVRDHRAAECFTINSSSSKPTAAALYCERRYTRFVIVDADGVQVYASDKRDESGAFKGYTHPPAPQRKPLTQDQIMEYVREAGLDWHRGWIMGEPPVNRYEEFARAVLAAQQEKK